MSAAAYGYPTFADKEGTMPASSRTSLQEAPLDMTDTSTPQTPVPAATPQTPVPAAPPTSAQPEQQSAAMPDGQLQSTPKAPTAEHEPADKPTAVGLSISSNTAMGFIGVLVTLFGSAIIGLLLYTLNNLSDRIITVEDRIITVEANLSDRIITVEANLSDRITTVEDRITTVEDRITAVEANLSDRITTVEANLSDRITTVEDRITAVEANLNGKLEDMDDQLAGLSLRQADMGETLSVLVAILNARREVEAAKAHQITPLN